MIDLGCFHDTHTGGPLGAHEIQQYWAFPRPLVVHFVKTGTTANGVGEKILHGCSGPVVFPEVLHVPALQEPPFSVRAALARHMKVHFCPGGESGSTDDIILTLDGRLCLTGKPLGGLHFPDEQPHASTATASLQQLT
jgi:hypothetical protein